MKDFSNFLAIRGEIFSESHLANTGHTGLKAFADHSRRCKNRVVGIIFSSIFKRYIFLRAVRTRPHDNPFFMIELNNHHPVDFFLLFLHLWLLDVLVDVKTFLHIFRF